MKRGERLAGFNYDLPPPRVKDSDTRRNGEIKTRRKSRLGNQRGKE